jgi:hypothetical protein
MKAPPAMLRERGVLLVYHMQAVLSEWGSRKNKNKFFLFFFASRHMRRGMYLATE